jgi:hypothetical protein
MELNDIKGTILDRMPAPERLEAPLNQPVGETKMRRTGRESQQVETKQPVNRDPLIDILGLEPTTSPTGTNPRPASSDTDILGQIFGTNSPVNTNPGYGMPMGQTPQPLPDMMSMLGLGGPTTSPTSTNAPQYPTMPVWSGDGISIAFDFSKSSPQDTLVTATYTNVNPFPVNNFVLQAAVPKVRRMILVHCAPSSNACDSIST